MRWSGGRSALVTAKSCSQEKQFHLYFTMQSNLKTMQNMLTRRIRSFLEYDIVPTNTKSRMHQRESKLIQDHRVLDQSNY